MADTYNGRKRIRKQFGSIRRSGRDAEPHRGAKELLRRFPDGQGAARRARRAGPAVRVQIGVPDLGFLRAGNARFRALRVRAAQVRRRRVPAARHDLCGAAEGEAAPDRVRCERGDRRQVHQGREGAGRLHGRHAVHDAQRHLRHQRHRARHRQPDAPLARRVLRSRPGRTHASGKLSVRRPHHSLSRLLARLRVRRQGHRLRAHRSAPQAARDHAALCAGHGRRGDPVQLLQDHHRQGDQARLESAVRGGEDARHDADIRPHRRAVGRGGGQVGREDHRQARPGAGRGRPQGGAVQRQRPRRQVPGRGHRRHGDGPHLRRGRRRAERQAAGDPERGQGQGFPDPRHRPRDDRRLHPQHPQRRQELQPRGSVDGRLPGDAPGRAADAGCGAGPVPRPVLRFGALRPLRRRPRQDEHAPRPQDRGHRAHAAQGGHPRTSSRRWSTCATARARSTTSITSATGACARSAS